MANSTYEDVCAVATYDALTTYDAVDAYDELKDGPAKPAAFKNLTSTKDPLGTTDENVNIDDATV